MKIVRKSALFSNIDRDGEPPRAKEEVQTVQSHATLFALVPEWILCIE
jgi:hypothetical protein